VVGSAGVVAGSTLGAGVTTGDGNVSSTGEGSAAVVGSTDVGCTGEGSATAGGSALDELLELDELLALDDAIDEGSATAGGSAGVSGVAGCRGGALRELAGAESTARSGGGCEPIDSATAGKGCICTGGPAKPCLLSCQMAAHGLWAHRWMRSAEPSAWASLVEWTTLPHPVVPLGFLRTVVGTFTQRHS
jgi:hypothetical protein